MADALALVVALLTCYLPGLALMTALGVRRPVQLMALAPAASVGVAGTTAVVAAAVRIPYNPVTLGAVSVVLACLGGVRAQLGRRSPSRGPRRTSDGRASQLVGIALVAVATGWAAVTWLLGLGGLSTVPQEHDMVIHAMMTAYIARTGHAAAWQLVPADVLTGSPVSFYPSGFHLLASVAADVTNDVVQGLNATTVVMLAVALPLSVASLTVVASRQLRLDKRIAMPAAGMAALVAAGMFRPAFQLMHDGGIVSNAVTLALAPGLVAGLLMLPQISRGASVAVGVACAGSVLIHPSAVASVGITISAWWVGQTVPRKARAELRGLRSRLLVTIGTAALLLVPSFVAAIPTLAQTSGFPPDLGPTSIGDAVDSTLGLAYGGYLDPTRQLYQVVPAVLGALGLGCLIILRRGFGLVAAWAIWSLVTVAAFLAPGARPASLITGFFYNAQLRVWSHVSLLVPVLAALGVAITAGWLAVRMRRRTTIAAQWIAIGLVVAAFVGYAVGPGRRYAVTNENAVATRYSTPDFVRVDGDDRRAIHWLAAHVQPGQRVFNSPNDGSTYLYVYRGVPVVNVYTLGLPGVPYSYRLLQSFRSYPTNQQVRDQLLDLNVAWVYVDAHAPGIGSAGSPEGWAGNAGFSLAPGLQNLEGLPGLTRAYVSGSVSVYSLDLDVLRSLKE